MNDLSYEKFFLELTGFSPRPFQLDVGLAKKHPEYLTAATGSGKTAAVLIRYLWGIYTGKYSNRNLLFVLPMRSLTNQVSEEARKMVERASSAYPEAFSGNNSVLVGTTMGGDFDSAFLMRRAHPQIIVSVADIAIHMLVGCYGSPKTWDIFTGMFTHDTWIVMDEVQLVPYAGATLEHFRSVLSQTKAISGRKSQITIMSATQTQGGTVNTSGMIASTKKFEKMDTQAAYREILSASGKRIVIVNTVKRSQDLARDFTNKTDNKVLCLHSRFTEADKLRILKEYNDADNCILVATQVVEAGVDITCTTMVSELSNPAAMAQRFGRAGRRGEPGTRCLMVEVEKSVPYTKEDIEKGRKFSSKLNGLSLTAVEVSSMASELTSDLPETNAASFSAVLFENMDARRLMTYSGRGELAPFVREGTSETISVNLTNSLERPRRASVVRVPKTSKLLENNVLLEKWDNSGWIKIDDEKLDPTAQYRLPYDCQGYSNLYGWTENLTDKAHLPEPTNFPSNWLSNRISNSSRYDQILVTDEIITLDRHLSDTKQVAESITHTWTDENAKQIVIFAAQYHDIGKKSTQWQKYIHGRSDSSRPIVDQVLAKSAGTSSIESSGEISGPRHEFLSALMLHARSDKYLEKLSQKDRAECIWAVLGHHGQVYFSNPETKLVFDGYGGKRDGILSTPFMHSATPLSKYVVDHGDGNLLEEKRTSIFAQAEIFGIAARGSGSSLYSEFTLLNLLKKEMNIENESLFDRIRLIQILSAVRSADWESSSTYKS